MQLGLVIYGSLNSVSGGYLYDRKLVEHLRREGDEVEIISLPWRDYPRHLGDNLSGPLHQRLASGRWDVLLQDELNHPSLFQLNCRLKTGAFPPIVTIVHHLRSSEARPAWQNRFYRQIEARYLNSVDGYIFNSKATRAEAAAAAAVNSKPGLIAYPAGDRFGSGFADDEITCRAALPGDLKIIFVGNLIPRKGLLTLLDALRQVPAGAWVLNVVGSGEPAFERRIRRRVEASGLAGRVRLLGRLSDSDLAAKLKESHVLCVPSTYEGFGIVYLEGMAFGLPAIAGASGGAPEIITDGEDGFIVPDAGAQALADRLALLAADRERLLRMSLAARRRYLAHPTWDETAARIRCFLLEQAAR